MGNGVRIDREDNAVVASRSLRRSGGSIVVSLPREILQGSGLDLGDDVEVRGDMETGEITIRKIDSDVVGDDENDAGGDGGDNSDRDDASS